MKNLFLHLGFIFIISGLSIVCVDKVSESIKDYCNDVDKSNEIVEQIDSNYKVFKEKSLDVKNSIVDVSKSFVIFLEDFPSINSEIELKVQKVENEINELSSTTDLLLDYCNYDLNNQVMNNQCSSFKVNFISMIDSYEEMLKVYNSVIKEYNDFSKTNGRESIDEYSEKLNSSIVEACAQIK